MALILIKVLLHARLGETDWKLRRAVNATQVEMENGRDSVHTSPLELITSMANNAGAGW